MSTGDIRYREARPADAAGLAALETQCFSSDRLSLRSIQRLIASQSATVLAATAGTAICGCLIVLSRKGSPSQRVYSLAVAPQSRGRGIAGRLLALAETRARRAGASELRLEVRASSRRLKGLYGRRGFTATAKLASYYADGADALRMAKPLNRKTGRS